MSINALGVAASNGLQIVGNDSAAKTAGQKPQTVANHSTTEDTTSFTSGNSTVQSLSQAALQTFPSRQTKVELLKQAVSSAQYQLDDAKIAESLTNADV
jgi:anti-sigma28 factor (negative regulator of flagellin synthesis)